MARRKSSRKQFILTLKKELMGRDPLGQELTEVLVELGVYCLPDDDAREALYARRAALIAALIEKYDVDAIEVEDSWDAYCRRLQKALEADGLSRAPIIDWWPVGAEQPYSIATNLRVAFSIDPTGLVPVTFIPASPPDGEAPQLQVTVNLAQINWWDLDRLATDVKRAAQDALTAWSRVQEASPHPLQFLWHVSPKVLERDLKRFDLHMQHGLSFRDIAFLEWAQRHDRDLGTQSRTRPLGAPVPHESSIRGSVARIHQAIYREPYYARRRRIDTPAQGIPAYHCPLHGDPDACSEVSVCVHRTQWLEDVNRTLPTDYTGRFRAMSFEDTENIQDFSQLPSDPDAPETTAY